MAETKKLAATSQVGMGAGAGVSGLVGFLALLAISLVFFITENYFISLGSVSLALLLYVTGTGVGRIAMSAFTVFFSSRHLVPQASYIQETLQALKESIQISKDPSGKIITSPVAEGKTISLPDNPLVRDTQKILSEGKGFDYLEYIAHSYYLECHELYDYTNANLDFVAVCMPIFGLMGTVLGLMSLFDNLGGDITVEALSPQLAMALKTTLYGALYSTIYKIMGSRFEQRIKTLDYEYESLCRALQVILESKVKIEIKK